MVEKDRSSIVNKTYLMKMIPTFYQNHLRSQLSLAEYLLLKILIQILQTIKQVSLESLANALPIPIKFESRRKKIQRFLSSPKLTIKKIWLPIIEVLLETYFEEKETIYLVIDRTKWSCINLLMISIVWEKRAIPIYFELLKQKGNSNLKQQTEALTEILGIVKKYKICVLGDREFCSVKLANCLKKQGLSFCLRLRKNEFIKKESEIWLELKDLGLAPGLSLFLPGVKVTKLKGFGYFNLACKWKRKRFMDNCQSLVAQLMRLNPNKRKYYQRGLRAMNLIQSVF